MGKKQALLGVVISLLALTTSVGAEENYERNMEKYKGVVESYDILQDTKELIKNKEINAIIDMVDYQSGLDGDLGEYTSMEDLFNKVEENYSNAKERYDMYNDYLEGKIAVEGEPPSVTDFESLIGMNEVSVQYFYDELTQEVAQVIHLRSASKVFRSIYLYDTFGKLKETIEL